ncbi:hypothetical protein D3298_24815, partial [Salmonella enterica]|nr:hypothetical protein [Salmonella enterica]
MLKHKEDERSLIESKNQLDMQLEFLINEIQVGRDKNVLVALLNKLQFQFSTYITEFENFIVRVSENGFFRSKAEINDVLISIENVLNSSAIVAESINEVSRMFGLPLPYQYGHFLTTTQIILKTHRKKKAKEIFEIYKTKGLSTYGFDSKE